MKLKNNAKNPTHTLLGISPDGNIIDAQISKFPHALIAGATGSGKTVMINTILLTAMAVSHPDELKLLVIDPKGNEFGNYKGLPHMLADPIIDLSQCKNALEFLANEMDYRMQLFQKYGGIADLEQFNNYIDEGKIKGVDKLPYIVLMIDELQEIMVQYKDEVNTSIKRLGAKARAAGVHMLLSTQTPRREYVDGAIKANVPTRIVLMVTGHTESLVALDRPGAEDLKGNGDFYASISGGKLQRGQAPLIEKAELKEIFADLREKYPTPELIDIDEAMVEAELKYKKVLAENTGKNPDDITMESVKRDSDSSNSSSAKPKITSSRTEEERAKAKKEHEEVMKKINENDEKGKSGNTDVSIDVSGFSLKARNERRKKNGEEEIKPKSGVIPVTSSRRKERQEKKKVKSNESNVADSAKTSDLNINVSKQNQSNTEVTNASFKKQASEETKRKNKQLQPKQEKEHKKINTVSQGKTHNVSNRKRPTSRKKKPTNTGSPLTKKR